MEKPRAAGSSNAPTTFERAFSAYLASLPDKKNSKKMIFDSMITCGAINAEEMQKFVVATEDRISKRTPMRVFNRIVKPMVAALKGYYGILDTMCQTNPSPAALVWGSLKIIVDCADRFGNLFETIKQQVQDLTFHLERINYFDELYKDTSMQTLLCRSYINVLRFWARVRKECERSIINMLFKSAGPFSTKKIGSIVSDLKKDSEEIGDRADMLEKVYLYDRVKQWLSVRSIFQDILEANHRRHSINKASHIPGTSEWLFQTPKFLDWSGKDSQSPIIWMSGDPGTGKSILCSRVIRHIQDADPTAAIAFHFFRFDQECSTIDLLRVMTGQLLESLRKSTKDVSDKILSLTETLGASVQNVMDMMRAITSSPSLSRTFLFIDGLDEELSERRWVTARDTLDSLISLVTTHPGSSVRLWLSSQAHNPILKTMEGYPRIHLVDQNESDIRLLFEKGMRELEQELDDIDTVVEEREHWFKLLKEKAGGNFLWAHYMIHSISEEAECVADIEDLIEHSLPKDINEYYCRQFRRIPVAHRNLASKIFSIICFSRRLLSPGELSDAMGVIRNPAAQSTNDIERRRPRPKLIQKLLSPLIVEEKGPSDTEKRYRLFHSTVKEFIRNNPNVLTEGDGDVENPYIGPSILADACLLYLSQPRYSSLLEKVDGVWKTAGGYSPDKDAFLRYAAKYWHLHLEDVLPSSSLTDKISTFLRSSNFQTLLQIQHLFVDSQFGKFTFNSKPSTSKFIRRAFPHWFVRLALRDPTMHFSQDYRVFIHEWAYLLVCGCCENPSCEMARYAGQIDRCIFGTLGTNNFMSNMKSRFSGFSLCTGDHDGIRTIQTCYEGYSACGKVVYLVQFQHRVAPILYFLCETWKLQTLEINEEDANWNLFIKDGDPHSIGRSGRAKPVAFDYDARGLRIGSQLHLRDANGLFQKIHVGDGLKPAFPAYFEEFLTQGKHLVTISRRRAPIPGEEGLNNLTDNPVLDDIGKLFTEWEKEGANDSNDSDVDNTDEASSSSDKSDTSLPSTKTGIDWSSGDETWSEGSTDVEEAVGDENAIIFFKGYIDSSSSSDSGSDTDGVPSASDDSESDAGSGSDGLGATPHSRFLRGFLDDDSDGDDAYVPIADSDDGSDGNVYPRSRRHFRKQTKSGLEASLKVFSISDTGLTCIFQLSRPIDLLLYDSPPVLHPHKPLIIWPMSPGNVLFAAFEEKTWFKRKLRPTTTFTRQIITKCHFSPCGEYLHIAILEVRRKPIPEKKRKRTDPAPRGNLIPLHLSLFVTTHRLSSRKTTRAPPTQIYRTKIELGHFHSLPVSHQLPFTFTWAPTELYFTISAQNLVVFRIRLFPSRGELESVEPVLVPRERIFLPETASTREVRFFPSSSTSKLSELNNGEKNQASTQMHVLIGSQIRSSRVLLGEATPSNSPSASASKADTTHNEGGFQLEGAAWIPQCEAVRGVEGAVSMPVGFYISSEKDFGGWVRSDDVVDVPADRGVGQLDYKVERFDVEEDCGDLEPYII
ncbi:hypothetical protein BDW74DRAFT_186412 [Aspergillus multicolor]|uniref:uncharacterized protein n=1 Tax=Aspergillus multicolor TaxID=41759 RepID=UPI003CCCA999